MNYWLQIFSFIAAAAEKLFWLKNFFEDGKICYSALQMLSEYKSFF